MAVEDERAFQSLTAPNLTFPVYFVHSIHKNPHQNVDKYPRKVLYTKTDRSGFDVNSCCGLFSSLAPPGRWMEN